MIKYELYRDASEVPYEDWAANGVKGLIFDKDGTLTEVNKIDPVDSVISAMRQRDLGNLFESVAVVSNNHDPRNVERFAQLLEAELGIGVLAISRAEGHRRKPHRSMGLIVAKQMGLEPSELGVVGDRRYTDVEFGMRLEVAKIALCERLGQEDARFVPTLRRLEEVWVALDRRRGLAA